MINYLMYVDDRKRFDKKEKEVENLIQTIRIYNQDMGMESGIKKSAMWMVGLVL